MRSSILLLVALLAQPFTTVHAALMISDYSGTSDPRYERSSDVAFIGNGLDLSGIATTIPSEGFKSWATMITPSLFLTANHARPANGRTYNFYPGNALTGTPTIRTVADGTRIGGTDLWIGRLNVALPSSIATYAIATGRLTGVPIFVSGLSNAAGDSQRLGTNVIDVDNFGITVPTTSATGNTILYDFDASQPGDARVELGDSGGPSFTTVGGQIAITGIHWFKFDATDSLGNLISGSGDTQVGLYQTEIQAAVASFGLLGETARFVAVPEPSIILLVSLGIAVVGVTRRQAVTMKSHREAS